MWIFLKNNEEVEKIIQNYNWKKEKIVKVSQNKDKLLWYSNKPEIENYDNYVNYIKDFIAFLRLHNSLEWYYFWKEKYKKEIIYNYWNYSKLKTWKNWYIVEWELLFNRHLKIRDIFKNKNLADFIHNFPPTPAKQILISYMKRKYKLDSFETWWMKKIETLVWKYIYKINAVLDWDYIIFKNKENFKIAKIYENI